MVWKQKKYGKKKYKSWKGKKWGNKRSSLKQYVKRVAFSIAERKYIDTAISVTVGTTPTVTVLNALAQGTSDSTRIGGKIAIHSIEAHLVVVSAAGTAQPATGDLCFTGLILDKDCKGAAPAVTAMYSGNFPPSAVRVAATMKRFKLLRSHTCPTMLMGTAPGTGSPANPPQGITMLKAFGPPLKVPYGGNAGTVADINQNGLFFICSTYLQASTCSMYGTIRVWYSDA